MKLTECECNQLSEATAMWFGRNGGKIKIKIKKVKVVHEHDFGSAVMPKGFSKHIPLKELRNGYPSL